jgi:hypothetical protein
MANQTGQAILDKMRRAYADLESYKDVGWVEISFSNSAFPMKTTFLTHFKRPNLFRFQSTFQVEGKDKSRAVWCDGKSAYSQFSGQEVERISLDGVDGNKALSAAVWKAQIPCATCQITPPQLLVPSTNIAVIHESRYLQDEPVMEEDCHRVQLILAFKIRQECAISRDRLILRKVIGEMSLDEKWVDFASTSLKNSGLFPQMENVGAFSTRTEFVFTTVELNPKIPEELFSLRF